MSDRVAPRPTRVEIVERRRLVEDVFQLDVVEYRVGRYDGALAAPARRLVLERGDSVAALLVDGDGVWLVEQFRIATYGRGDGWLLELVAGIVDANETPETALRREVREETGFAIGNLQPIGRFYLSPGASSERVDLYVAQVSGRIAAGGGVEAEGEDIRVVPFTRDSLREAWRAGRLVDAKTAIAVTHWLGDQQ